MAGNTVETVVSLLVPVGGEAADASKGVEELDHVVELVDDSEKAGSKINPCKLADGAGGPWRVLWEGEKEKAQK